MTPRIWRAGAMLLIVAIIAAGLTLIPSRTVTGVAMSVSGTQTIVCPSQDPALLATTVRGSDVGEVLGRATGTSNSTTIPAEGVTGTAQPHVLSGTQAIGGMSSATSNSGDYKGLWLAACSPASVEQAFVGLISDATHSVSLFITNPDRAQAAVDVEFFGPKGRVISQGSRGLTVLGNSTRQLALAPLVSDEGPITAVVTASTGRTATYARVIGAGGSDYVSASASAATTATIAGTPGGSGARNLVVTNTSDRRATVAVEVLSASSTFAAVGAETISVEAATTVTVPLESSLRGEVAGLRLSATAPVVAALWSTSSDGDLAVSPARPAYKGRTIVPLIAGSVLVATNSGTNSASLTVTMQNAGSIVDTSTKTVNPGTTVQVPLTAGTSVELITDSPDLFLSTLVTTLNGVTGIGVAAWGPGGPSTAEISPRLNPILA